MDFFEHQAAARRTSKTLAATWAVALPIIVATSGAVLAPWMSVMLISIVVTPLALLKLRDLFNVVWQFYITLPLWVHYLVGCGWSALTLWRGAVRSRRSTASVASLANLLNAFKIDRASSRAEQRLRNVSEEMAVAAGIAAPDIYVLRNEKGINGFAAGWSSRQWSIFVTQGALDELSRDELQGLVAHETSHLLNADTLLNMQLLAKTGAVYQILLAANETAQRMREDRSLGAILGKPIMWLTLVLPLQVIGYVGTFFGHLIRASVMRQREFLADACAVQFTRYPDGIGGVLRKIAANPKRSTVEHRGAEQFAHFFLAAPRLALEHGRLATHPPIEERIRRIYGHDMPALSPDADARLFPPARSQVDPSTSIDSASVTASIGDLLPGVITFLQAARVQPHWRSLQESAQDQAGAQAMVLALLADSEASTFERQLRAVKADFLLPRRQIEELRTSAQALGKGLRLPLLDLAAPTLRALDLPQRRALHDAALAFIAADGRVHASEFALLTVLELILDLRYPLRRATDIDIAQSTLVALVESIRRPQVEGGPRIDYANVAASLASVALLPPLQKPAVVKRWVSAAMRAGPPMSLEGADVLRAMCAAIDCPMPPLVEQHFLSNLEAMRTADQRASVLVGSAASQTDAVAFSDSSVRTSP